MTATVRQIDVEEVESYRQLRLEALRSHPESFASSYEEESQADRTRFEQHISQQVVGKFMLGAYHEHELIGICGFMQGERNKTRHRGSIVSMYVVPAYVGQGIGRQLLAATLEKAFAIPEVEFVEVEVVAGNSRAEKLYEQAGFRTDAVLESQLRVAGQHYDFRHMLLRRSR